MLENNVANYWLFSGILPVYCTASQPRSPACSSTNLFRRAGISRVVQQPLCLAQLAFMETKKDTTAREMPAGPSRYNESQEKVFQDHL